MSEIQIGINKKSITNDGLVISGIASTNHRDSQGEAITLTPNALKKAIPIFLSTQPQVFYRKIVDQDSGNVETMRIKAENNGMMWYNHGGYDYAGNYKGQTRVGKVLSMTFTPGTFATSEEWNQPNPELVINTTCLITDPAVIELIQTGFCQYFSLHWWDLVRTYNRITGEYVDEEICIIELSPTPTPVNRNCKFLVVDDNMLAESFPFTQGQKVSISNNPLAVGTVKALYIGSDENKYAEVQFEGNLKSMSGKMPIKDLIKVEQTEPNSKGIIYDLDISGTSETGVESIEDSASFDPKDLGETIKSLILKSLPENTAKEIDAETIEQMSFYLAGDVDFHTKNGAYGGFIKLNSDGQINYDLQGAYTTFPDSENKKSFPAIKKVIKWNDLSLAIEYQPGDKRHGKQMRVGYGHIRNHLGADGEALDCYIGDNLQEDSKIFRVTQVDPTDGDFDEYKFMFGFNSIDKAKLEYVHAITPDHFGKIEEVTIDKIAKYKKITPKATQKAEIVTDFPKKGDNKKISLQNSEFKKFDKEFALKVKNEYPELWKKGGNILGNLQFKRLNSISEAELTSAQEKAIKLREAWSARHFKDFRLPGVIAQIKWLTVGSRGQMYMKTLVRNEMKKIDAKKSKK